MPEAAALDRAFFVRPVADVARELIGTTLLLDGIGGLVVETEAYDPADPASHSFAGRTVRNAAMFGPPGHAYVYRSYGIHWCLNLVCGPEPGSAVLIRAIEPRHGVAAMQERRPGATPRDLCRGPGRLCRALGITGAFDGRPLDAPPFLLRPADAVHAVATGPRIGITRGIDTPWRFMLAGSPYVSRSVSARRRSAAGPAGS